MRLNFGISEIAPAYPLIKDLDPHNIGVKIDFGNNCSQEGYEIAEYQIPLLGEYIAALGAKDGCFARVGSHERSDKGWEGVFLPSYEGQANYPVILKLLRDHHFTGPAILMPFYDTEDFPLLFEKLKKEIKYFRDLERI